MTPPTKGDRTTAEHEAAHAVITVLCGWLVGRVTIAPSRGMYRACAYWPEAPLGLCESFPPTDPMHPIPLSPFADFVGRAAGMAWECRDGAHEPWTGTPDQGGYSDDDWRDAIDAAQEVMRHPLVEAAIHAVADALEDRKSGTIYGTTVEKIMLRVGLLVKAPCRRCHGSGRCQIPGTDRIDRCLTCHGSTEGMAVCDDVDILAAVA